MSRHKRSYPQLGAANIDTIHTRKHLVPLNFLGWPVWCKSETLHGTARFTWGGLRGDMERLVQMICSLWVHTPRFLVIISSIHERPDFLLVLVHDTIFVALRPMTPADAFTGRAFLAERLAGETATGAASGWSLRPPEGPTILKRFALKNSQSGQVLQVFGRSDLMQQTTIYWKYRSSRIPSS